MSSDEENNEDRESTSERDQGEEGNEDVAALVQPLARATLATGNADPPAQELNEMPVEEMLRLVLAGDNTMRAALERAVQQGREANRRVQEAEEQARADRRAREEAREEALRAREERDRQVQAAEEQAQADRRAREEAEEQAQADRRAREEALRAKEEAEEQAQADRRAREEAEEQAQADRRAREEALVAQQQTQQLNSGTYYATFDEVWNTSAVSLNDRDYEVMIRHEFPSYEHDDKDSKWNSRFRTTMDHADRSENEVAQGGRAHRSAEWNNDTWPVDVLKSRFRNQNSTNFIQVPGAGQDTRNESLPSDEVKTVSTAAIAHLVPASFVNASLYHHVAIWVFGKLAENREPKMVQKLIQGSAKPSSSVNESGQDSLSSPTQPQPSAKRSVQAPRRGAAAHSPRPVMDSVLLPTSAGTRSKPSLKSVRRSLKEQPSPALVSELGSTSAKGFKRSSSSKKGPAQISLATGSELTGSEPRSTETTRRVGNTGLKHMICNQIRLYGQDVFFDMYPCLIIVPILSLEQAKNWNGEGYHAIFMISTGKAKTGIEDNARREDLENVAATVHLLQVGELASKSEIDAARELLTASIKGLAVSLNEKSPPTNPWVTQLDDLARKELATLRAHFAVVSGERTVLVPQERDYSEKPVRKVTFAPAFGPVGNDGHPAPDPLLLVSKAALNWAKFHQQPAMKGAADIYDSHHHTSEYSFVEMKQSLAIRELDERSIGDKEIIGMEICFENPPSTNKANLANISISPTPSIALDKVRQNDAPRQDGNIQSIFRPGQ